MVDKKNIILKLGNVLDFGVEKPVIEILDLINRFIRVVIIAINDLNINFIILSPFLKLEIGFIKDIKLNNSGIT